MLYPAVRCALTNGSLVKYIICHSEIFVNFLFVEATVQIFVHVLRYTKAGGVYMSTYEKLQDQTCADGIDVMDYEFNSPNIKGLYCNSTVAINNSIWRNGYTIPFSWFPTLLCFDHARNWYPGSVHYGKRWMENRYRSKGCIQKCDQRWAKEIYR